MEEDNFVETGNGQHKGYKPLKFDSLGEGGWTSFNSQKTASGRASVDNGDIVAKEFRGDDLELMYIKASYILTECGRPTEPEVLKKRYEHLNLGMQRMNIGNQIRGLVRQLVLDELPQYGEEN